ncbi:MAG: hypothetical protein Q6373_022045 [Candidatus Sigynarchaeota archaeon]
MALASEIVLGYFERAPGFGDGIPYVIVTGILLLIAGNLVMLVAFYNFPENAFYELEWKKNVVKLVVIDRKSNACLYSCEFEDLLKPNLHSNERAKSEIKESDAFLSSGLMGIDGIISEITGTKEEKIKKIKHGNFFIYLEPGTLPSIPMIFALVVKKELLSIQYFLRSILNQFETFYKDILSNLNRMEGSAEKIFRSFDIIVKNIIK